MASGSASPIERRRAWARHPLTRFVLIGALLFAVDRRWPLRPDRAARATITLDADDVARLRREWTAEHGDPPASAAEESRMIERALDDGILEREALRLDFDRGDRLVRDRLVKLGGFLGLAADSAGGALESEARALGLESRDPVIRRYLLHLMEIALAGAPRSPSEEQVRQRYEQSAAAIAGPERVRLSQIYLGREAHGEALGADAEQLLRQLRQRGAGPDAASSFGEPFAAGAQIGPATAAEIARRFGPVFAEAVANAPEGEWSGPLPSSYGLHLVWIAERSAAGRPPLAAVRNQIAWSLIREEQEQRLRDRLRELRLHYSVELP